MFHATPLANALRRSVLLLGFLPALALAEPVTFNIPAQPLGTALAQLAEQSGLQVIYNGELVQGLSSPGINGSEEPEVALQRLLQGSGLVWRPTGAGSVVLERAASSGGTLELGATDVTSTGLRTPDITSEGSGSYAAKGASILKGAQSLKEIPQSVSVMTRQRMEDQNLSNLRQVMEQAPGVYTNKFRSGTNGADTEATYYSRGFAINSYMIDGVPSNAMDPLGDNNSGVDGSSAIYDRVEILRGAAGLLVGNGSPGGTVNLVRKRPTLDFQQRYSLHTGSWNNYQGEIDLSGPLVESGALRGRMVAAYEERQRFWGKTNSESPLFYGVAEMEISPSTNVSLGARHEKNQIDSPQNQNFSGDSSGFVPDRDRMYNSSWGYEDKADEQVFFDLKHELNERWGLSLAASYWEHELEGVYSIVSPEDGFILVKKEKSKTSSIDTNIIGTFDFLGYEHKLSFGGSASRQTQDYLAKYIWDGPVFGNVRDFNAEIDWPYSAYTRSLVNQGLAVPASNIESKSHGIYGKLDFRLTDRLIAIIGARSSWYDYEYTFGDGRGYSPSSSGHVGGEITPYAGLIYEVTPEWSAYFSYADIFNPQWGYYTRSGSLIDHETGRNYEFGLKGDLYEGRLNTAFAIYQVDLMNTAQSEAPPYDDACPGNPTGQACYVNTGKKRTRGFDAEINGEVLIGWQVGAGYTYTQTEVMKADNPEDQTANLYSLTPRHMLKLFSSYAVSDGLVVGGGVQSQSSEVSTGGLPVQSGYSLWSAFMRYKINKNIDAGFNVNNIFDKKYWENGTARYKSRYGEPRSFMITLRAKY